MTLQTRPDIHRQLIESSYEPIGESYLTLAVHLLAEALGAQLVVVTRAIDMPASKVRILASNRPTGCDQFDLEGTPCQVVYQGQHLTVPQQLAEQFPHTSGSGFDSFHGFPFYDDKGRCFGHLALFFREATTLSPADTEVLHRFIARLGKELARLDETEQLLVQRKLLTLQANILRMTTSARSRSTTLQQLIEGIESILPQWRCCLLLRDTGHARLRVAAAGRLPEPLLRALDHTLIDDHAADCGRAAWRKSPVCSPNTLCAPGWQSLSQQARLCGIAASCSLPILAGDALLGVLDVYHDAPFDPEPAQLHLMEELAALAAQVIQHDSTLKALRDSSEHYRAVLQQSGDGTIVLDQDGRFLEVSQRFVVLVGAQREEEVLQSQLSDWLVHVPQAEALQILSRSASRGATLRTVMRRCDGSTWDAEVSTTQIMIKGHKALWASARDVTTRQQMEMQLLKEARIDSLTGAANRRNFLAVLESQWQSPSDSMPLALMMLDLDHFKRINDRYGHSMGDEVLKTFCREVGNMLRQQDLLGRLGGEEFAILLPGMKLDNAGRFAELILQRIREVRLPGTLPNETIQFSCSIGVVARQAGDSQPISLINRADAAMYQAKKAGRNAVACRH